MNSKYRLALISKLYRLKGEYTRILERINPTKELKLYKTHVPKVIEFYERNKSKELLYYLLKSKNYKDINTLLTEAEHIARQSSGKRRKLLVGICLKGIDYSSLYIISNQASTSDMKKLIKVYYSNIENRERILKEAKEKLLKRTMNIY